MALGYRHGGWVALCLAALVGGAPTAHAGDGAGLFRGHVGAGSVGVPMRLGFPVDRWRPEVSAPRALPRAERCRRWRATADRLGETFAGHTLRKTIVHRHCALFEDEAHATRWDWPWRGLEHGNLLLPRLHRTYGAWSIHCATGKARGRCALVQVIDAHAQSRRLDALAGATTHFVIDRVAGREMLLWRLHLPLPQEPSVAAAGPAGAGATTGMEAANAFRAASVVRYRVGRAVRHERFPVCTEAGCLMEARGATSGSVATALAGGLPVGIEIVGPSGPAGSATVSPGGFEAALAELIRLRKAETRP